MPSRIQNYGDFGGDRVRGHHPPACTCYNCNEERRRLEASKEEERRAAEYDQRVAETSQRDQPAKKDPKNKPHPRSCQCVECVKKEWAGNPRNPASRARGGNRPSQQPPGRPRTGSQQRAAEVVRQSEAGVRPRVHARPASPSRGPRRRESKAFQLYRAITTSALRYALALHATAVLGLVVYALAQGGTSSVLPLLGDAAEAYVRGWRTVGTVAGLG